MKLNNFIGQSITKFNFGHELFYKNNIKSSMAKRKAINPGF